MKKMIIAAAIVGIAASSSAATPPTYTIKDLTDQEAKAIQVALELASAQCSQNQQACVVGFNKPNIMAKIQAAYAETAKGK